MAMRKLLAALALLAVPAHDAAQPGTGNGAAGASEIAPLRDEPVELWSFGPLTFEAEPVPWERHVLVTGTDATRRRALVVLDAESGRMLARALFTSSRPLATSAAGERVAVRTGPERVDLFRLRGARLLLERSFQHGESVSAPRLAGDELTLREGDELVRYHLGRREPVWRARVPGAFHGAPALRGRHVLAGWYAPDGEAHLAWLDGASGRVRGDVVLGRNSLGRPPEDRDALALVPHARSVFVGLVPGLRATSGAELPWARATLDGESLRNPGTLHALQAAPLETVRGWIAPERTREGDTRWVLVEGEPGGERVLELASHVHHAWLGACTTPPSGAGDVVYLGPCAADVHTLEVLWRRERAPAFRPVPVAGGVLVVEGDRLRRLGSEPPPEESAREIERVRARVAEEERALGEELAEVAWQALRAGDGERAASLAAEAEALGASGRTLALLGGEAERALFGPSVPRAAPRVKGVERSLVAREREARARLLDDLARAAGVAAGEGERILLLRELFLRAPGHARGLELLRRLLPEDAPLAGGDALEWLEFLALSATRPVSVVGEPEHGAKPTPEEARLAAEREGWRTDVAGYRSERLLVLTAGTPPDAVARAVRAGELVCDVLESVFAAVPRPAGALELVVYPTREEYLEHSGSDLGGLEAVLGFTSGHFDVSARVSRLFLPQDARESRLLETSTHELTHHWLSTRAFGPPRSAPDAGGFWVVEAIATWAEELRLDPRRGTWSTAPGRSSSLDTLVHADAADLLPWRSFLALSFDAYCKLETRTTCELVLDWRLGSRAPRSPMQLFYVQGAALAHYLYEQGGGAHRELLLRAVESYHRGEELDVAAELRVTPEELGERVGAWARAVWSSDFERLR
jgi:hypothetical protein